MKRRWRRRVRKRMKRMRRRNRRGRHLLDAVFPTHRRSSRRVVEDLVEVAHDGNTIAPRMLEVEAGFPVCADDEGKALVEPTIRAVVTVQKDVAQR